MKVLKECIKWLLGQENYGPLPGFLGTSTPGVFRYLGVIPRRQMQKRITAIVALQIFAAFAFCLGSPAYAIAKTQRVVVGSAPKLLLPC
ncbi:hypothetical protein BDZ91DRAFT_722397 [Kalaharituber pfeilii]|nr:hypothetical protein BDZ91DRAFT_722397 [Kalaharituber pfeilii]